MLAVEGGKKCSPTRERYCLKLITNDTKYQHRFQKMLLICALFAWQLLPRWRQERQKTRENGVLRRRHPWASKALC